VLSQRAAKKKDADFQDRKGSVLDTDFTDFEIKSV